MLDRKILVEKLRQFGVDWISQSGFLDEGQVEHILDLVEQESRLTQRAADGACPNCGSVDRIIRFDIEQCEDCGYPSPAANANR